jgi:hypothetical protein
MVSSLDAALHHVGDNLVDTMFMHHDEVSYDTHFLSPTHSNLNMVPFSNHLNHHDSNSHHSGHWSRSGTPHLSRTPTTAHLDSAEIEYNDDLTTPSTRFSCLFYFIPLNVVGSMCCVVYGPRLDLLRRKGDYFKKFGNVIEEGKEKRGWKWWLVLAEGKLYFYQYFGDMNPRYISDLTGAVAYQAEPTRGGPSDCVVLRHLDGRLWRMGFVSSHEMHKFLHAVKESTVVLRGEPSMYLRSGFGDHKFHGVRTYGHNCLRDHEEDSVGQGFRPTSPPPALHNNQSFPSI